MKTKIPTSVLLGGAAVAALALSQRARAAAPSGVDLPSRQPGSLTKDQILQLRQDAMDLGINGKFYLFDGVPYWTYLNKPAPSFVKDGTTWYLVGRGRGSETWRSAFDGTEVSRRDFTEWGKVLVLGGASSPLRKYEEDERAWRAASQRAWSRGEGLTQPPPGTPEAQENRAKRGQNLSALGGLSGAAAGAAAGTALFPGVGTVIGAIVGGAAGLLGGRELQEGELEKLTEQAKELGGQVESGLDQAKQDKAAAEDIEAAQASGEASNE